ncbi:MAG: protein kinase [Acidobacteriota bacterium]|nr:protein kinase [Acidobacteriota bacterium]
MTLPSGTRLGPYVILAPIGAGGMGEVYRARDDRLGRDVAIKVPPEALARDPVALARFEREARAVASLAHPNVLDLHDFGTDHGICYAVTELLEGETLRARLAGGPLRWREAVEIVTAVADGLAAAHERGIVHRDLKPENIFLTTEGRIKILDFGLARVDREKASEASSFLATGTDTGTLLGTVGYMSPEQVRGERADARSDIFSLGCVLSEMITGERVFRAATSAETLVAILREDPPDPGILAPDCPEELLRIIRHCIDKKRDSRIQSARDLALSLRDLADPAARLSARRPVRSSRRRPLALGFALAALAVAAIVFLRLDRARPGRIASLAVLPFADATADANAQYLSEGLTESLINRLSRFPDLRVAARTSVFSLKRGLDGRGAGRALNVRAVLAGRVARRGDDLVVHVELMDVEDGSNLWGEQFVRRSDDLMALPEEISREIAERLQIRLTGKQAAALARKPTGDPEAFDLYLQGRYQWNKRTIEGITKSVDLFERAVKRDPRFAEALAGLAEALDLIAFYGFQPPKEIIPKVRDAAIRALEIDESIAAAHTTLADVRYQFDWNWPGAEQGFRRALSLDPNSATGHQWYSNYLSSARRFDESFREIATARRLDPLNMMIRTDEGLAQHFAGHDDQAARLLKQTIQIEPTFPLAHFYLALVEARQNTLESALTEARAARRLSEGDPDAIAICGYISARAGRRAEAEEALQALEELSRQRFVSAFPMAVLAVGMGEKDKAFAWLEKAYEEKSGRLVYLNVEPAFDPLRNDPRFRSLVERLRFPS